jgi:hypothetical protein
LLIGFSCFSDFILAPSVLRTVYLSLDFISGDQTTSASIEDSNVTSSSTFGLV